jgi:hypothetical protein
MTEFNWDDEPETMPPILYVGREVLVYDDGVGDPQAIFYHSEEDPEGCALEVKRRREIDAYMGESDTHILYQDRGEAVKDCIIPLPNTVDVLGILKGDTEFSPIYKRIRDFSEGEAITHVMFGLNWGVVCGGEAARLNLILENM